MTEFLDAIATAFRNASQRPAVFDTEIRKRVGAWKLDSPVPAREILLAFAEHEAFRNASNVIVPLHGSEDSELTGEYVEFRPDTPGQDVVFYDFSAGEFQKVGLDYFNSCYPAWRLRYWHPDYTAPSPPSFVYESATASEPSTTQDQTTTTDPEPVTTTAEVEREDEIFRELRWSVEQEREAERERNRELYGRLSTEMYLSEKGGIPYLKAAGMDIDEYGQQAVKLELFSPEDHDGYPESLDIRSEFGIFPGNEVIIDSRSEHEAFPFEAEVLGIEGECLSLGIYWNRLAEVGPAEEVFEEPDKGIEFIVGQLMNPVPYDRELDAIEEIEADERKRDLLRGEREPGFAQTRSQEVRESNLNRFQYKAAQQAIRADDVYCIHGPPGTGKTRTLVELITALAKNGQRVLVCAHSNQAVDNLLIGGSTDEFADRSSLHHAAQQGEISVARVGENSSNSLVEDRYVENDRYQSDVVCATTSGAAEFGTDIFDVAVLDEASQASIPASMIPFSRAERLVLAGDHKQLPPFASTEQAETSEFEPSMFEELVTHYGTEISTTLRTQYRMNEAIAAFPNQAFYDGVLMHGSKNRDWTIGALDPLVAYDVEGEEGRTPSQSYYNEAEATVVAAEVETLLDKGAMASEIGVITPYSGQIGKIQSKVSQISMPTDDIKISTVDAFQGSEREAIIVSFVRSNETGASGFLTFGEEGPRRLNVALTRAKKRLVLVGDFETLATNAPDKHDEESAADVYADLREFLQERNLFRDPPT